MRRPFFFRCALGVVASFFVGALSVQPAWAGGVDRQEQEVRDVVAEIERQHRKVDEYNEDYLGALNEMAAVEAEILVSQQRIADQQAALAILQSQLASVVVDQFMGGGNGALGPLFEDPERIGDGLQRDHLATVAVNAGAASTDEYETLLSDLAATQQALEDQQARAEQLAERAETSKANAEQAAADLEERLVQEKAKLGDLIEKEQARLDALAAEEYRQQQERAAAKAAADAAATAAANKPSASSSGSGSAGSGSSGSGSAASGSAGPGSAGSGSSGSASSGSGSGSGSGGSGSSDSGSSGSSGGGDSGSGSGSSGSGDSGSSAPPVSSRAGVAVNAAQSQLGVKYQFAASSPGVAFDCSGLTSYAWAQAGVSLPHQSAAQYASTPHVPKEQAQPGDLIFYYSPISHVGIYIGGGSMIHAPQTGSTVSVSAVRWNNVIGVSRPG